MTHVIDTWSSPWPLRRLGAHWITFIVVLRSRESTADLKPSAPNGGRIGGVPRPPAPHQTIWGAPPAPPARGAPHNTPPPPRPPQTPRAVRLPRPPACAPARH